MEELATHGKPGDYFIALYGQVIDISNFISKHPGGEKILLANVGKDATQKFESIWVLTNNLFYHSYEFVFVSSTWNLGICWASKVYMRALEGLT